MNTKLKLLRDLLEEAINKIDSGNSNKSDKELNEIIAFMSTMNRGVKRISKRQACDNILHCSTSTFEKYVQIGLIPEGQKVLGFKEKSWAETDFDEVMMRGIREYKRRSLCESVD